MKRILFILSVLIPLLSLSQEQAILKTYSQKELQDDFDLMCGALKEAHTGLYWYTSIPRFDSIMTSERQQLKDGMDSYSFFKIASKIVAYTKEGHCRISSSRDIGQYFNQVASIPPIMVKVLNGHVYLTNDIEDTMTSGLILLQIDKNPIDEILDRIFLYSSKFADGYIQSGKVRYSVDDAALAYNYVDYVESKAYYTLKLLNPVSNDTTSMQVRGLSAGKFRTIQSKFAPRFEKPIQLSVDQKKSVAKLSLHSFRHTYYDPHGDENVAFKIFSSKIDSVFGVIRKAGIKNLIIDVRNNGGGTEGYEDYVFSYLTSKPYVKYKYVQTNALTYSFLDHTQYNTDAKKQALHEAMHTEFYRDPDGRYLRKDNFIRPTSPQKRPFSGNIYVLISGRTYSGGSEFAAMLKDKGAIFIGEETGGGFYGQTSGFGVDVTLPNSKIKVRIPLLKFVTNFQHADIPLGRGVLPDYKIQPTYSELLNGVDSEMQFASKLIGADKHDVKF